MHLAHYGRTFGAGPAGGVGNPTPVVAVQLRQRRCVSHMAKWGPLVGACAPRRACACTRACTQATSVTSTAGMARKSKSRVVVGKDDAIVATGHTRAREAAAAAAAGA